MKRQSVRKFVRRRYSRKTRLLTCGSSFAYLACLLGWSPGSHAATLVDLDATALPEGPLASWTNNGSIGGTFDSAGDTTPAVATVAGAKAVQFVTAASGAAGTHYLGPVTPASITGNGARTVEAWLYDAAADQLAEKAVLGWGRRGADGLNNSFGHGTDPNFGAVGHWGAYDTGYGGTDNVVFDRWTYVVYTYDPATNTDYVYVDGKLVNTHVLPNALNTASVDTGGNPIHFRVARQNTGAGAPSGVGAGTIAVAKLRVTDQTTSAAQVKAKLAAEMSTFWTDTDGDGLPDWYEDAHGLNKNDASDAAGDLDSDGATNLEEFAAGTDPQNADTDGDGVSDGAELHRKVAGQPAPTNPLAADSDGDGLSDKVETGTGIFVSKDDTGSDPLKADTDGDGFSDGNEVTKGSDPNKASSVPGDVPLIDLNAAALAAGPLNAWPNAGVVGGEFDPVVNPATVETLQGAQGVTLNGADTYYRGPVAPNSVTGNPNVTLEAWLFNPDGQDEESVIAWGRRGGPDGTEYSLNHGTDGTWGATTHWGAYDVSYNGKFYTNRWTHIAETYNSTSHTTRVYVDGTLANNFVEPGNLSVFAVDANNAPLPFTLGAQNNADGTVSTGQLASLSVGRIRIWDSVKTDADIQTLFNTGKATYWPDADNDGLPDWYENAHSTVLNPGDPTDAAKDPDNDGLTNLQEFAAGTDPANPDTDGDGLKDGVETNTGTWVSASNTGTNPLLADSDGDGLKDSVETNTGVFKNATDTGTDPNKADTDGDTFKDGTEVFLGSDPTNAASKPGSDPIVKLDAGALTLGPLDTWPNTGSLVGDFTTQPDALPATVEVVQGVQGVTFDGVGNYYTGPEQPPAFAGNADHAIEAWVLNPTVEDEECVFAWGRREGPDGTNVSFGDGANASFGAVGHWGAYDVGWNGNQATNRWNFIAYSYTSSDHVSRVYRDGVLANNFTEPGPLNTWGVDTAGNPLHMRVATQNNGDGTPDLGRRGSLTIARLRVYAVALPDTKIASDFAAEKDFFNPQQAQTKILSETYNAATGKISFTWTPEAGKTYAVEAAGVLGDPAAWSPVATGQTSGSFTDTVPTTAGMKFYRLRVE